MAYSPVGCAKGLTGLAVDIAMAALYLSTPASRYVTGELLRVSEGV